MSLSNSWGEFEGAKATMALTGKQAETFADQLNQIGNASGDVEEGFDKVMNSIAKKMDIIDEAWSQGWRRDGPERDWGT